MALLFLIIIMRYPVQEAAVPGDLLAGVPLLRDDVSLHAGRGQRPPQPKPCCISQLPSNGVSYRYGCI